MTIFGTAWDDLTLDDVETYLAAADDEALIWKAKATKVTPNDVRRAVCGFANGSEVAYLILGARQDDAGAWHLEGVPLPHREPATWVSTVLGEAISPRPFFRARSWPTSKGHVVIVEVEPVAAPPCIANGTVYERLPGVTQPIRDSVRLHDLVEQAGRLIAWLASHTMSDPRHVQPLVAERDRRGRGGGPPRRLRGRLRPTSLPQANRRGHRRCPPRPPRGHARGPVAHGQDFIRLVARSADPATWLQMTIKDHGLIRLDWSIFENAGVAWGPRTLVDGPIGRGCAPPSPSPTWSAAQARPTPRRRRSRA